MSEHINPEDADEGMVYWSTAREDLIKTEKVRDEMHYYIFKTSVHGPVSALDGHLVPIELPPEGA